MLGLSSLVAQSESALAIKNYAAKISAAHAALEHDRTQTMLDWLATSDPERRAFEYDWLSVQAQQDESSVLIAKTPLQDLSFHPNQDILAIAHGNGDISIHKASTGEQIRSWSAHPPLTYHARFSPNGQFLLSSGRDHMAKIWDWQTGTLIRSYEGHDQAVPSAVWSPAGDLIASCSYRRLEEPPFIQAEIHLWSAETGTRTLTLTFGTHPIADLAWGADGKLAAASWEEKVGVWEAPDPKPKYVFNTRKKGYAAMNAITFSPDGKLLAAGGKDCSVTVWNMQDGSEHKRFEGHGGWVQNLAFDPYGQKLASASIDQTIRIWSFSEPAVTLHGPPGAVGGVAFSPQGRLASVAANGALSYWNMDFIRTLNPIQTQEPPYGLVYHPHGIYAVVTLADGQVLFWDPEAKRFFAKLKVPDWVNAPAFTANGRWLLLPAGDGVIHVVDAYCGLPKKDLAFHQDGIPSFAVWPKGGYWASVGRDNQLAVWSPDVLEADGDSKPLFSRKPEDIRYTGVTFHPSEPILVVANNRPGVEFIDLASHETIRQFQVQSSISDLLFSADGKLLLTSSSNDPLIYAWDESGKLVRTYRGHSEGVTSLTLSPDGKRLVSGGPDFNLIFWDLTSGQELMFQKEDFHIYRAAFHPDGNRMMVGVLQPQFRILDARPVEIQIRTMTEANGLDEGAATLLRLRRTNDPDPIKIVEGMLGDRFLSPKMRDAAYKRLIAETLMGSQP